MRNSLGAIFQEKTLSVRPRIVYVQFKKGYSLKELIYVAFKELKKSQDEILELPKETIPAPAAAVSVSYEGEASVLDSLYEDIEEKNRFLLSLVEDLNKEHARSRDMFFQVILSLVNALEARDPYTEGHSQRVAGYADMVAQQLGWNKEEREKLRKASLLHDLGKIGIPDGILHKRDRLNDEEFDFIKKHEIIAVKILEPIRELAEVLPWILYHHERWDGKGYPHGLGGNAIPVAAQLMSLADVYDALTTGRDYKKAVSPEETLAEIEKGKGAQFNPELADVFIRGIRAMLFQK
jgi:putative two-component system response regulator